MINEVTIFMTDKTRFDYKTKSSANDILKEFNAATEKGGLIKLNAPETFASDVILNTRQITQIVINESEEDE